MLGVLITINEGMMHDLIPDIPPENVLSGRFRVHAVKGDAMEPTLRGGRDYALLAPVSQYTGEGIYLVHAGAGLDLFRVMNNMDGKGGLVLFQENRRDEKYHLPLDKFEELVTAIVVADIRTRDERFLRGAA
jgi:hypothetical protein